MRGLLPALAWFLISLFEIDGWAYAAGTGQANGPGQHGTMVEHQNRSREVLVTFSDEREDRVPLGSPASNYRRRGDYGNSTWSESQAAQLAEDYGLIQKAQWPVTVLGVHCVVYEVPPAVSVDSVLSKLGSDRRVESAQQMQMFHVMADRPRTEPGMIDPYQRMQAGLRAMHADTAHRYATGHGVAVVVIDTGADETHEDLRGRVSASENFVTASPKSSAEIHGTAVAGVIAATAGNGRGIAGIAPGANVRVMKACWQSRAGLPDAQCNTFTLALALNTAINAMPQIINLSLNGPADALLERLVVKASSKGIIVVASDAPGPENAFPAMIPGVIAVRAASHPEPGRVNASHSLVAPGTDILTTVPHDQYGFMTGSSFAAAHVSGLIALLLELNQSLTREQIVSILGQSEAQNLMDSGCARCVDACGAVASITRNSGLCAAPPAVHEDVKRVAAF